MNPGLPGKACPPLYTSQSFVWNFWRDGWSQMDSPPSSPSLGGHMKVFHSVCGLRTEWEGAAAQVLRGRKRQVVFTGQLSSLRRVKDVVKEVPAGTECGAALDGFLDWQEGDIISCYETRARTRTLEEASSRVAVAAT